MAQAKQDMDEVSLNDKRVEITTYDRYKGRKGITDRIAVISKNLIRAHTHYVQKGDRGSTFRCLSTKDHQAVCCDTLGTPDQKFGLVLFHYLTDENGSLLTEEKCAGKVKLWVISDTRYAELSQVHKEFPLLASPFEDPQVDLLIKCTEDKFQKMTFTPTKISQYRKKKEWYDAVLAMELKARPRLAKAMGQELTELDVMDLLKIDAPMRSPSMSAADLDVGDVLGDD